MTTATTPFAPLTGGCRCGAVRFRMEAPPIITHCCHCRTCQKVSGSAFSINAMIETDRLTIVKGEPQTMEDENGEKEVQCPACRYALWAHLPRFGDAIAFVGVGMLDQGESLPPEAHYFTRSKHPWIVLPAGVPTFDELGDPGKAGFFARIAAAVGAG
jgi:hypothetical protein